MRTSIAPAKEIDLPQLHLALRDLSKALGDPFRADVSSLKKAVFGANPAIRAMLARNGQELAGVVNFNSAYSTVLGCPGLLVSDLWTAAQYRGQGLGQHLLRSAAVWAGELWGAKYLKLSVYDQNPKARTFYDRLGFVAQSGASSMILQGPGFNALKGSL